ncbi:MAG TPA: hypothetical protein VHB46_18435 [Burkholderiales bacterium]|nr:hypothetical protein [Burkholderiales bacterium]
MKILSGLAAAFLTSSIAGCGGGGDGGSSEPPQPSTPPTPPALTASVSSLALAASGQTLYSPSSTIQPPLPTGVPRKITITNTGSAPATGVTVSSSGLPSGTSITSDTCNGATLAASASCTLTITPGSTPTHTAGSTTPTPATVSISGGNTNTVAVSVSVLTYGSLYQNGYVFALDDTTADTASVGGKAAAQTDSYGSWGATSSVGGINETSTALDASSNPPTSCNGNLDGACNTARIKSFAGSNFSSYAAGKCGGTISGRSDWYLPAICEFGFAGSAGCGSSSFPTLQNMQISLISHGGIENIGGIADAFVNQWSSTESAMLSSAVWQYDFTYDVNGTNGRALKSSTGSIRCARALTP